jgi:hypothetical protein
MNSSMARTVRGDFTPLAARMALGNGRITDALVPAVTHRVGRDEGARNVLPLLTKHGYAGRLCR